jgi:superfamily I DNA/RNA helicase
MMSDLIKIKRPIEETIIKDIKEFCRKNNISTYQFGMELKEDNKLIKRLLAGKSINTRTMNKIYTFMDFYNKNPRQSKLDPFKDDILKMLDNYATQADIARKYKVSRSCVHYWLESRNLKKTYEL